MEKLGSISKLPFHLDPNRYSGRGLAPEQVAQHVALDAEATHVMQVHRWQPVDDISKRFNGNPTGAKLAWLIAKFYYKTRGAKVSPWSNGTPVGDALDPENHLVTPFGIITVRRPDANGKYKPACSSRASTLMVEVHL